VDQKYSGGKRINVYAEGPKVCRLRPDGREATETPRGDVQKEPRGATRRKVLPDDDFGSLLPAAATSHGTALIGTSSLS
jgi:hypothetical protein